MSDKATFDAYAVWAKGNPPGEDYLPMYVEISGTNQTTINFKAYDSNNVWKPYHATWGDLNEMWAAFPSTLPSGAQGPTAGAPPVPGALPAPGAFGILYLSVSYTKINGIAPPKWPRPY